MILIGPLSSSIISSIKKNIFFKLKQTVAALRLGDDAALMNIMYLEIEKIVLTTELDIYLRV